MKLALRSRSVLVSSLLACVPMALACMDGAPNPGAVESGGSGTASSDRCVALTERELIDFRIVASEYVAAVDDVPSHCRVAGVIETEINFELLLPDAWKGRFLMGGGGGYVGSIQNQAMTPTYGAVGGTALERGYVTAGTDTGHVGSGVDASWALDRPDRQENWGHRAVHLTAEASKSVIRHYYDASPDYSYFAGCSRGGGQGMMESQRYPDDFDGIVSGAPAYHWTAFAAGMVQTQQAVYPAGEATPPIITSDTLQLLATSIDTACDLDDGVDDDILADPRSCGFRPDDLPRCHGDAGADCVTEAQLAAINAVYDGPTADGEPLFFGFPFGGENEAGGWDPWVVDADSSGERGVPSLHHAFGVELYKQFVFGDPEWDFTDYDFSSWREDTAEVAKMLDANATDLGAFRDTGGKIIYWTGWSDLALTPFGTIDYYEHLRAGDARADEYARLYMLPGVLHCGGGPGADRVDWIEAIRVWVEEDIPPGRLVARNLESDAPIRSRPVCPYPQTATYSGEGDEGIESSFVCVAPQ